MGDGGCEIRQIAVPVCRRSRQDLCAVEVNHADAKHVEEMKPYAQKTGEYLAVAWKFVAAQSAKASAYLATLYKNVA